MIPTQKYEMELRLINERLERIEGQGATPSNVNGLLSAIVITSPESLDAVAYSIAGMLLGLPASGAAIALGADGTGAAQVWGALAASGVGLGVIRLGIGTMDLTGALGMLADKYFEWKDKHLENAPESTREVPVFNRGKPVGFVSLPEPTEFRVKTKKIPSVNIASGVREIAVDKICLFLKNAVATGQWARGNQSILNQKEHPDVKAYLQKQGWWKIIDPPTLRRACAELRGGVTNRTERTERTREQNVS